MERVIDEAQYVLAALYRTHGEVSANPTLFAPDARKKIEEAILQVRETLRVTGSQIGLRTEKETKVA